MSPAVLKITDLAVVWEHRRRPVPILDGVSLTIAALRDDGIEIALVPFTLEHTTLARLSPGDDVNVEVDLLAKYAERLASG